MIRTFAVTNDLTLIENIPLERLESSDIKWYWVDFDSPTEEEKLLLKTHFNFHPLAIEDCLHFLQRPKLDYYDGYDFFVLHTLNQSSLAPEEVDIFLGHNFIVTFHLLPSNEIGIVRQRVMDDEKSINKGLMYIFYLMTDKIVDGYFPSMYRIEDELNEIESKKSNQDLIGNVYEIRSQLLKLRRTIFPMRELMYRILNSERVIIPKEDRVYFMDISDHLLKLSEMIESNREMTADIRDNYISINSNRTNTIMKTLTVMTSIFIPLTFIASIYGMNFEYMPELTWHGGYFAVLGVMAVVGSGMLFSLWRMGWFK
ncbi:magnesium/cobalt transporter CorA [Peribacillus muralis]|uniref:magnesium/cobalt transporter CorA n=1 Tax=Peribacillus muralis TaxID=264697 RepID=UPI001F4D7C4D|nr:magnesium/cobalt transporter CorA [Peribacillus muralis]MCK1992376.1 magnesium/cobalt transporter CorA [Peribacillus muralis]MCK2012932.1 magnesium/cobalt transporter CorA [Peribacillus muralis]